VRTTGDKATCAAGQTVAILRSRSKGGSFAPLGDAQADADGAFALARMVRKTGFYVARVASSPSCEAAESAAVKVKVKRRRR
jgi:hypothetical protein